MMYNSMRKTKNTRRTGKSISLGYLGGVKMSLSDKIIETATILNDRAKIVYEEDVKAAVKELKTWVKKNVVGTGSCCAMIHEIDQIFGEKLTEADINWVAEGRKLGKMRYPAEAGA